MSVGADERGAGRLSREETELAERVALVIVEIRVALLEVAWWYTRMAPGERDLDTEEQADAWDWLQRLAGLRREAEVSGLGELGDDYLLDAAETLLGALEDSLVLALSGSEERRNQVLAADEVIGWAAALDEAGTWGR